MHGSGGTLRKRHFNEFTPSSSETEGFVSIHPNCRKMMTVIVEIKPRGFHILCLVIPAADKLNEKVTPALSLTNH